jgi:glutamate-1-semialdehyde aminotransferase
MTNFINNFEKSRAYRARVHDVIPGGAHTYSKGDDQFPELAPAAITHGLGAYVWDVDGNRYLDCSMGLTSVSLGHAYPAVLDRVRAELERGVNFQRPSVLELETAEAFLDLVPQHDMVKFAKNGSTVTTAAVKLARAKTGRPLVAFPGNHPFYSYDDWFIGRTACARGVPEEISALSVTFDGCSLASLQALFEKYPDQIACVITEPERSTCGHGCGCVSSASEFLRNAIDLAHAHGALFILDEMVSGFKSAFPGTMTKEDLHPDMATWGKGIANGFSFCALTGKRDVMELGGIREKGAEKVFLISSTHGAETHAMAAAVATIQEFREKDVVGHNHRLGREVIARCQALVRERGLEASVKVVPCPWMPTFLFLDGSGAASPGLRTLFMQEMIRNGVLFQGLFVPSYSHGEEEVGVFVKAFGNSLEIHARALSEGWQRHLTGAPAQPVFRRFI